MKKGTPETGECLDAQSWESEDTIVLSGTEDFETLEKRLPDTGLNLTTWPPFPDDGLHIVLPLLQANQKVSLHYIVASNALPEPKECSCWFAVDINHDEVLAFIR
jgi:hypothetical protein